VKFLRRQITALLDANIVAFDEELLDDLRRAFPTLVEARGEEETRARIRFARDRALAYGFSAKAHVAQYVGVAFLLGARFDTDDALPWAGRILGDPTPIGPAVRIERLVARAMDHVAALDAEGGHAS
jgi:hypothetical protein